jgi:hypothetical protein
VGVFVRRVKTAPADPDDISAQINLIGVAWRVIDEKPSAAPNERRLHVRPPMASADRRR